MRGTAVRLARTGRHARRPVIGPVALDPVALDAPAREPGAPETIRHERLVPGHLLRSGTVRPAARLTTGAERVLPVHEALRDLLPDGGLRRGSTLAVAPVTGGLSLLYALLATASAAGTWCAVVGVPELGAVSAAEYGVVPERFALVPEPGPDWMSVTAALLDGFGLVLVRPAGPVTGVRAGRLAARARQRGAVLLAHGDWPGADVALRPSDPRWLGIGAGRGRLRRRAVTIDATGRGAAARPRSVRVLLPSGGTGPAAVTSSPAGADHRSPVRPARPDDVGAVG